MVRQPERAVPDAGGVQEVDRLPPVRPTRPVVLIPESSVRRVAIGSSHDVRGLASYYCSPAHPICHYAYPLGSMVAAACGKLRTAIGPHWRGRLVTVRAGTRSVVVKLVDYGASTTKTIDLYWEPMRRLGGTGVLSVVISW